MLPVPRLIPCVLDRLRSATRVAHASIETAPAFARLLAPDLTIEEYVQTLRRLEAFHTAIAAGLRCPLQGCPAALALLDGERLQAVDVDLNWFGARRLAPPVLEFAPDCLAAALGCLYVIEGSSLGGRIIGRHVASSLGVGAGAGGSFYCGTAAGDSGRRWKAFQHILATEIDAAGLAWEPVTVAAQDTFSEFEAWMREEARPSLPGQYGDLHVGAP